MSFPLSVKASQRLVHIDVVLEYNDDSSYMADLATMSDHHIDIFYRGEDAGYKRSTYESR